VQEQAMGDGSDTHNVGTSEPRILEQRESQTTDGEDTADGEDLPVQATSGDDISDDLVGGAQLGDVDSMELNASSQGNGADDDCNQLEEHQQVKMDVVDRPTLWSSMVVSLYSSTKTPVGLTYRHRKAVICRLPP
jgi:hypothetical protein